MSDVSIKAILDAYYYRQAKSFVIPDGYFDIDEMTQIFSDLFGNMPGLAASDPIEGVEIGSERFLRYLLDEGCFQKKEIPFSRPVYKFDAERYKKHRGAYLSSNDIYAQSTDYPQFFSRAFEGFLDAKQQNGEPEKGETIPREVLVQTDWAMVAESHDQTSVRAIQAKVVELATAIQQADISDRHRSNLLSRVRAVQELLTAPDPSWDQIVDLLNYRYLTAFLNAYAIIYIILGIAS